MSSPYVGEIRMFGGTFAPAGWAFCDGQLVPISENDTLFNLIGTTYGGDGEETFALPDLQGRIPIHAGTGPGGVTRQLGETDGTESVTLSVQQIPQHSHAFLASTENGTAVPPTGGVLGALGSASVYRPQPPAAQANPQAITIAGGSQPHENMHPFLTVSFIISLFGIFPTQN
jgi:microcystin-dependent protein